MGYKKRKGKALPQPPKEKQKTRTPPTPPSDPPVSLTIIYYELRKDWPVPQRLLESKIDDLCNDRDFVADVDEWLNTLGLSEDISVERNLHPHGKEGWAVRMFVEQGGFVAYRPNVNSQDHTGLLYRQALRFQNYAKAQADMLLAEEAAQVEERKKGGKMKEEAAVEMEEAAESSGSNSVTALITALRNEFQQQFTQQQGQISSLKEENLDLRAQNLDMRVQITDLRAQITEQQAQITVQQAQITEQQAQITSLNQEKVSMRSTLNSLKAVYKRKLLESFRIKVGGMFPDCIWKGNIPDPGWWSTLIRDPRSVGVISSASGIAFDMPTLALTSYNRRSIQKAGGVAAHVITEEPEVFATLVCQYDGAALEGMKKIYQLVFERDAVEDAFGEVECCKCPVHCPAVEV